MVIVSVGGCGGVVIMFSMCSMYMSVLNSSRIEIVEFIVMIVRLLLWLLFVCV